jgi:hypothetical protein
MADGLTVADLVERAGPPNDAVRKLWLRRARYWAAHGVFPTEGRLHRGTGRHRRFSEDTTFLAALLFRLGSAGLPLSVLDAVAHVIRGHLADPTESHLKQAWRAAKTGQDTYIGLQFSDPEVQDGPPIFIQITVFGERLDGQRLGLVPLVPMSLVNLGAIFSAMRH